MAIFPRYQGSSLLGQACSVENMTIAWRRVRGNIHTAQRGRSAGVDAVTVRDFEADWPRQMERLTDEILHGQYTPLPPRRVMIPKQRGGERAIAILAIRDRVAQRAVQQVLEPVFDPYFLDCSYGCRPRVGVPDALRRVDRYASQGLTWVADADISGYFDAIDHRILLGLLRQRVDELPLLRLIAQWLQAGALTEPADAPEAGGPLTRGGRALRRALDWGADQLHRPGMAASPVYTPGWDAEASPYADGYRASDATGQAESPLSLNNLIGAAMMARPVLEGARRALPYVKRIGGKRLVIAGALAAGALAATELAARAATSGMRGAPQGGSLSPLLANIYLHPFDLALTSQGLRLVRFVDDFVIMCSAQEEAEQALGLAEKQLGALRLTLNREKTRVVSYADGLEFLGEALAPRRRGPSLTASLTSFEEADQALRAVSGRVRRPFRRKK
jgi:RNA-directed DNA polymerase